MSSAMLAMALGELLRDDDADHRCVNRVLDGSEVSPHLAPVDAPVDPELAALADELRRLRAQEPLAPALLLLSDAAELHPVAVERHLAWLAESPVAPVLVLLDEWQVPCSAAELLQLTS
jgi:hypothetical protein